MMFWMTVIVSTSWKCWWIIPMPASIAARGESNAWGSPSTRMVPASGS